MSLYSIWNFFYPSPPKIRFWNAEFLWAGILNFPWPWDHLEGSISSGNFSTFLGQGLTLEQAYKNTWNWRSLCTPCSDWQGLNPFQPSTTPAVPPRTIPFLSAWPTWPEKLLLLICQPKSEKRRKITFKSVSLSLLHVTKPSLTAWQKSGKMFSNWIKKKNLSTKLLHKNLTVIKICTEVTLITRTSQA